MIKIAFATYGLSIEGEKLLGKIEMFMRQRVEREERKIHVYIDDLKTIGETKYDIPVVVFGPIAEGLAGYEEGWIVPDVKRMLYDDKDFLKHKKETMDILSEALTSLLEAKIEEPTQAHVETLEGVTVGTEGFDINMTDDEAKHLKRIRDILGGGKMVITKGDLKIEVD